MSNFPQNQSLTGNGILPAPAGTQEMEQALRVSELSYRRLFEAAQDGILILEVDTGRITDVNPFLARLLGFSHAEMIGKTVGELSPFKDVVSNQAMLERLQHDGYVRYEDLPLETRDGRNIAVEFVSNVYQAGDRKVIQCNIRDITKRKLAEIAFKLLAAIVESSDDAIIGKDLDGVITSWNHGAQKIFGYPAAEIIGTNILRLIPAGRQDEENQILCKIKRGESVEHFETVRQTKEGRLIDVSVTASPIKDAAGKSIGVSKVARDISERKRAGTALLESKRFLKSTLDALSSHIAILDEHGVIVEVNAAWHRFASSNGFLGGHGVGTNYLQACATAGGDFSEEARAVGLGIAAVMAGESEAFQLEYPCHGTQVKRWFVVHATRFHGHGPVRVVVAHENVTERKLAENELLWKTTLLEAQLDSSIDGILVVDADGNQLLQNRRMAELWNLPQEIVDARAEAAQQAFGMGQTKNPRQFDERVKYLYAHPEETGHDEIELINGTVLDRYSSPVRDKAGKHYGRIWSFRDITERRKLEQQIRQSQKMESIGQLAGGIAHDFNNILAAIVGNIHLARLDAADQPVILAHLDEIAVAATRAADLVKQILAFSRQNKQEREPIELNHVVLEALKLLRASVPASIRIQTELTKTPAVLANPGAIHQLIMNLGVNAWHAMGAQPGELKVGMRLTEVDADLAGTHPDLHPGNYVRLSLTDTGCGMTHATLERIYDPFFTTKPVGKGTGLGLSVVHGIMKSHDGGISVYSQPGEGTTFHLYFPVVESEAVVRQVEVTPIPRGHGEQILFVDDEAVLAGLGKRMLERLGYVVTVKTCPLEALATVRAQPDEFALVIADLTMPGMDGATLGTLLRQLRPQLPIIITTGYSRVMTAEKVAELGFRELLNKPADARTLGEAVHRALHRQPVS
ncbi:MAG: PAS domain S-box protein [Verrucomicrobiae bacterium]|nr:PAS domain S-box protein [Verrucomicrobiae bacterium]